MSCAFDWPWWFQVTVVAPLQAGEGASEGPEAPVNLPPPPPLADEAIVVALLADHAGGENIYCSVSQELSFCLQRGASCLLL